MFVSNDWVVLIRYLIPEVAFIQQEAGGRVSGLERMGRRKGQKQNPRQKAGVNFRRQPVQFRSILRFVASNLAACAVFLLESSNGPPSLSLCRPDGCTAGTKS